MKFSLHIRASVLALLLLSLFAFSETSYGQSRDDEVYKKGEAIFKANCASCHKVHTKLVGPALVGVSEKYDKEWLYAWIKNSQALVKAGDPQAVAIFEEYNKSVMNAQNLSNAQIDEVLGYLDIETALGPLVAPGGGGEGENNGGGTSGTTMIFLGAIAAMLLVIMFALSRLTGTLNNLLREKMGRLIPKSIPFEKRIFSKKVMAALSLALLIFVGYAAVDSAQKLGRQQNYAPAQPIKFSHELHAGKNKIECQYCHFGASKGKSAVIPSPNLCMNCHKAVKEGPEHGTKEIAKIYAAVGWDPDKGEYIEGYEEKPIEWVRIHNLPDHVYFNHSQHVVAGKVECQECHGPVEEMKVLRQHSTLGMGWCINCHRDTEVQFQGNGYYDEEHYKKFHEGLKNGDIKKVTVEDIGGTECQKCHY